MRLRGEEGLGDLKLRVQSLESDTEKKKRTWRERTQRLTQSEDTSSVLYENCETGRPSSDCCPFPKVRFLTCKAHKARDVVRLSQRVAAIARDVCEGNSGEPFTIFLHCEGEIIYNGLLRK